MPTLVWVRRRPGGDKVPDPVGSASASAAAPDAAVSSVAASVSAAHVDPTHVRLLAVSSKQHAADGGRGKERSRRDLPRGVTKLSSGRFESRIWWCGKTHYIGSFDTPEQASAAYVSVMRSIEGAQLSAFGADAVDVVFDAARRVAAQAVVGYAPMQTKKSKTTCLFDAAKKKAIEVVGESKKSADGGRGKKRKTNHANPGTGPPRRHSTKRSGTASLADRRKKSKSAAAISAMAKGKTKASVAPDASIPRGVTKKNTTKWQAQIYFAGKSRYIGVFEAREDAALAYEIAREELQKAKISNNVTKEDDAFCEAKRPPSLRLNQQSSPRRWALGRNKRIHEGTFTWISFVIGKYINISR